MSFQKSCVCVCVSERVLLIWKRAVIFHLSNTRGSRGQRMVDEGACVSLQLESVCVCVCQYWCFPESSNWTITCTFCLPVIYFLLSNVTCNMFNLLMIWFYSLYSIFDYNLLFCNCFVMSLLLTYSMPRGNMTRDESCSLWSVAKVMMLNSLSHTCFHTADGSFCSAAVVPVRVAVSWLCGFNKTKQKTCWVFSSHFTLKPYPKYW